MGLLGGSLKQVTSKLSTKWKKKCWREVRNVVKHFLARRKRGKKE